MGHHDGGKPQVRDQPAQQVEKPRLHGHVETAGRLVHEHETRTGDQVARDLETLAHAAGKRARLIVDAVFLDLDALQPVRRGLADASVVALPHRHQPLSHIGAGRHRHAQPVRRVLVHEAPVRAHQEPAFCLGQRVEVTGLAIAHPVGDAAPGRLQPGRYAVEQRRLARSALSNDGKHFAGIDLEGHVPAANAAAIALGQPLDTEEGKVVVTIRGHAVVSRAP